MTGDSPHTKAGGQCCSSAMPQIEPMLHRGGASRARRSVEATAGGCSSPTCGRTISPDAAGAEPLTVSTAMAPRLIGISESHFHALRRTWRFGPRPIKLGRSVRFRVDEIKAWIAAGAPPRAKWEGMKG
jgi:predicted DNA-binding transcriptional regulator AlpA